MFEVHGSGKGSIGTANVSGSRSAVQRKRSKIPKGEDGKGRGS